MNELSLYILDLTQNSVTAGAKNIRITVSVQPESDRIVIVIEDDGCGMDEAMLARVSSPFTTTRKTRKVGLGVPMARQICEMCEGSFAIESKVGVGTKLRMEMRASHVDCPPWAISRRPYLRWSPRPAEGRISYSSTPSARAGLSFQRASFARRWGARFRWIRLRCLCGFAII